MSQLAQATLSDHDDRSTHRVSIDKNLYRRLSKAMYGDTDLPLVVGHVVRSALQNYISLLEQRTPSDLSKEGS